MAESRDLTPYHDDGQMRLYHGDVREVLRGLPAGSVQCVVTSPPYWSLRDYGIEPNVWGGKDGCEHDWSLASRNGAAEAYTGAGRWQHGSNTEEGTAILRSDRPGDWKRMTFESDICGRCGAWRGALGLEPTPEMFVAHTVDVFREVRRVLADDGTLWLNIGDSYNAYNGNRGTDSPYAGNRAAKEPALPTGYGLAAKDLKPKDLVGIPWMVAFALRADGWYLRADIIWHKTNPMPESIRDRTTKAHEYLFLLAKSERYRFDSDAIREQATDVGRENGREGREEDERARPPGSNPRKLARLDYSERGRNKRSVWSIPTAPFAEAHFATFPPALVEPCILAGCPEGGTVLDPFIGSGTTAMVARRLGRRAVGIDLNAEYLAMAVRRCGQMSLELTGAAQ